tara:strand:- start:1743 stop:2426 length:684 start_codon:yes stop_codon:yes gene_type:complete
LAKRLTEKQIEEIIESFINGEKIDFLSNKFSCTNSTITRNLKKKLGELKYSELIKKKKFVEAKSNQIIPDNDSGLDSDINNNNDQSNFSDTKESNEKSINNETDFGSTFFEIPPLNLEIENTPRKELSSVALSDIDFPKIVYMIVDKKIELEVKYLKDYPEWKFLPDSDLDRKSIEIFFDLKIAKRYCSKEQKVIKVPNTKVFQIAAPFLLSRGISRIVSNDKLIAL